MDLSCIISSGDLELYVLGMLSSDDAYKIEQLAKLFPEIQAELEQIEDALLNAANEAEVAPSPAVKDALFSRLKALPPVVEPSTNDVIQATADQPVNAPVIPMFQRPGRNSGLSVAAIVATVVALGALAYAFISNSQQRTQMAAMQQKMDSMQNYAVTQQQQLSEYSKNMRFYQDTGYKMINLLPMPNRPKDLLVQVLWDKRTKAVYAANVSLPKAPAGKQYQLWAIVNGKPVSAGMLNERKGTIEAMSIFNAAEAFAITLEQAGGVSSPTIAEMYVLGKV